MNRINKCSWGIIILVVINAIITYCFQIGFLTWMQSASSVAPAILLMLACSVIIIMIHALFYYLDLRKQWVTQADALVTICIGTILYILFMILIFPHISVPYDLIPRSEMGLGFLQLLIQLFSCGGASMCCIVSGIRLLYVKKA